MILYRARNIFAFFFCVCATMLPPSSTVTPGIYKTNFCMCDLDTYLLTVRSKLQAGVLPTNIPPTPTTTPSPRTTKVPTTTAASTSSGSSATGSSTTGTGSTTTGTGTTTTGSTATGSTTTGSTITGSTTTGSTATGSTTAGSTTTGSTATGSTTTGSTATGSTTTGSAATGSTTTGSTATGSKTSQATGSSVTGSTTTGTGSTSTGTGSTTTGTGTTTTRSTATGSTTTGSTATGSTKTGSTTTGSTTTGSAATGSTTTGSTATGSKTSQGSTSASTSVGSTTSTHAPSGRRKRAAQWTISNKYRTNALGVLTPTWSVVYDTTVRMVDDVGVNFTSNYQNCSLCSCTLGSVIQLNFCLINVPYNATAFSNPQSNASRVHISKILPWLDFVMNSSAYYIRVYPTGLANYNGDLQIVFNVEFNQLTYLAAYEVQTSLANVLTVPGKRNEFLDYETNFDDSGCISVVDMNPAPAPTENPSTKLRFLGIPIALGVFALLVFCLCIGNRDKFYVRFW